MDRPLDAASYFEAALILGVTPSTVRRHVVSGRLVPAHYAATDGPSERRERMLSRADVEALALRTYPHRQHTDDAESYWVTSRRAAG